jgi:biotin operon repressor
MSKVAKQPHFQYHSMLKSFRYFALISPMLGSPESLAWPLLARPYGQAERALGRLACALEATSLHPTWLWREIARVAVAIAQASGRHAKVDQLRMALIGAPIDLEDNTSGLAAAKRIFLAAAPLFRAGRQTDSKDALWPQFWDLEGGDAASEAEDPEPARAGEGDRERERLIALVKELVGFADDGRRPALINLLVDLRRHAAARRLPPHLMRLALPLALAEAGVAPKAAPGLLGGRRLPLGMSRASPEATPLADWLALALGELALEADQSHRRLIELTRQHQAWRGALSKEGLRRHARAPAVLDLLAATPVLSIGLVARHLGCSHVAAGKIMEKLRDLGVLIEQTARSRHKIFVAGDLAAPIQGEADPDAPLSFSEPAPAVDMDAIGATLDGLFADLERLNERARDRVMIEGVNRR